MVLVVIMSLDICGWCCQYVLYVGCGCCFNKVGSRAQATLHQELSICMGVKVVYIYTRKEHQAWM